jgi:hypothetical protein
MKKAISYSSDIMKSIDLDNASYQTEGLRMLEEYKPEIFNYDPNSREAVLLPVSPANKNSYENLLQ